LQILLIEDDLLEQARFSQTLTLLHFEIIIIHAEDGQEALAILTTAKTLPNLILLDLNMPRLNGIEFLKKIRTMPNLKLIPVVVFSTSTNLSDINSCYELGIASFIQKPFDHKQYKETVKSLINYWSIRTLHTITPK
tara:strand:+ start:405 stop:815 length:411 start_codon:yes stop_codon:yes gene_type:complete